MKYIVKNLAETEKLAREFSDRLKLGDIILLSGDLGAGKTTFTQFVLKNLGVKEVVNSPTFAILKSYESNKGTIHHFDTYRITTEEAIECGFDEILSNRNSIIFIEWAENIREIIPSGAIKVNIRLILGDQREFEIIEGNHD